MLRGLQAQLAAAEALRSQLEEAQEALEENRVAHAAEMEAAAAAAAAEAAVVAAAAERVRRSGVFKGAAPPPMPPPMAAGEVVGQAEA